MGPVCVGCLGHYKERKEWPKLGQRKDRPKPKKNTRKPKKEVRIAFALAFCFCFCFTPFFHDFKGIKTKEKTKTKKNRVRIRPFLDGYGLGTRIRTTLVRILIPGPATDPHLRICSPVLASRARMAGLILHFLNGLFDMNFYLEKGVPPLA